MSQFQFNGCRALITGASAGIGREFACQLADRATSLILVARRRDRLEELRDELIRKNAALEVHVKPIDLSDENSIIDLSNELDRQGIAVDLLINNAGLGDLGPFATSDVGRVKEMLAVNIEALTLLTRSLLPAMIARKRGAILNVSSSASFLPIAGFAVYAASKAYVTSFSEAIRAELHGTGVTVTALCPGPVHTEFMDVARRGSSPQNPSPAAAHVAVDEVVRAALHALEAGKPVIIPGFVMKFGMLLIRLTPMPILRWASRLSAKV